MHRRNRCIHLLTGFAAIAAGEGRAAYPLPSVIYQLHHLSARTPLAPLTVAADGSLYGTAWFGGAKSDGLVFRLVPPSAGQTSWTASTLYSFSGTPDGAQPWGGVLIGRRGELYGTTRFGGTAKGYEGGGTVWRLRPPTSGSGAWTEDVLYKFRFVPNRTGPTADGATVDGGVVMDRTGALYGTTEEGGLGFGTVFRLAPPQRGEVRWTETVLYRFTGGADGATPSSGLSIDRDGILYGSNILDGTTDCGTAFQLAPPAAGQTEWTYSVLHSFTGGQADGCQPIATPTLTRSGTLYGTTYVGGAQYGQGSGTVYQLSPPGSGQTSWTETVLWHFGGLRDGAMPYGSVVFGPHGVLYGTTSLGGAHDGGTVFEIMP